MRLLLDTTALLRWMGQEEAERTKTGRLIANAANDVLVSVVSLWEIAIKNRIGKLDVPVNALIAEIEALRFTRIGIEDAHLRTLGALPIHHRDPFDRLLIAQAVAEGARFVSSDREAAAYPVDVLPL